ncbi:MAG: hypothetical protein E5X44_19520 [Mesorhizobium sp.]|nr:MAG: hypothetical protein E5X44_19520 [Mesorhizobium sp.]
MLCFSIEFSATTSTFGFFVAGLPGPGPEPPRADSRYPRDPTAGVDEVTLVNPGRLVPAADVGAWLHSNFLRQQRNQLSIRTLGEKAFMAGRGVSAT